MTPYHTNRCIFLNADKDCRKADYKAVWLSISTKVSLHNFECVFFEFGGQLHKVLGVAVLIWPQLCYYYCNNMELNSWLRSLLERCTKHWMDSSRKFQDHLQTQGNKINLNDDYNKNILTIATTKILMNKNICMYTYSNTVPESPSPSTSEVETTATSYIISLFQSDSESDQSTDSLPPSPKQPRYWARARGIIVNKM